MQRAIEIAQPLINEKRHRLHVQPSSVALWVQGDEIRLTQILANLLTNAAKYTPAGGEIWLEMSRQDDRAVLEVRDNGVGVEAHSDGAGQGSRFVVVLPLDAEGEIAERSTNLPPHEPTELASQMTTPQDRSATRSRRVLIVEDTAGIARMTAILFEKLGHQPVVAFDGATALKDFDERRPEMVILDLNLPDMSGMEVMREMRRLEPEAQTLLVALTGHSDEHHRQSAAEAGCDEYLVKPVDIRDLMRLVDHPKLIPAGRSS